MLADFCARLFVLFFFLLCALPLFWVLQYVFSRDDEEEL